jgi:peptidase S51-like protein
MTKYVLNSGGAKHYPDLRKQWHQEIIKGLDDAPAFLLCNFAQGREYWERKFQEYTSGIAADMPDGIKPTYELAMPAKFAKQCSKADVIYIHGGDTHLLQYWMKPFDLPELFKDKVVATSSAGSALLVTSYWACDWRQCGDGLGIIPIKLIPHYQSNYGNDDPRGPIDWQHSYDELKKYGDDSLPIYALKEGEYAVFEQ